MKLAVTMAVRTTAPIFADDSIAPCRRASAIWCEPESDAVHVLLVMHAGPDRAMQTIGRRAGLAVRLH